MNKSGFRETEEVLSSASSGKESLRLTIETLERINQFSMGLAQARDLKQLYTRCLCLIKDLFALDYSSLFLLDEGGGERELVLRATVGFPDDMVDSFCLRDGEGLPSFTLRSRQVETVDDFSAEDRFEVTVIPSQLAISSAIAAPMMVANQVFGTLIGHAKNRRVFKKEEKLLFQVLANHAAVAIENAMHIESLSLSEQKRERKIEQLQREKEKTKERTDEFESIFSNLMTGVMLLKGGRFLARCNQKFVETFGYDSDQEILGMSARELHISDYKYQEFGELYYKNLIAGKIVQTEYILRRKNGEHILCRLSGRAIDQTNPPDLTKGFVWIIDDISRQKEMEEELLRARKLESIEVLAGGIGHDFNNMLSAILGNIALAQRLLGPEHEVAELLGSAKEASDRAKELTSKLLLFTRRDASIAGYTELAALFGEIDFKRYVAEGVSLEVDLPEELDAVRIMPDHLKVILQNILQNADSCMPDGGIVRIGAANTVIDDKGQHGSLAGKYVEINVSDTGLGIDPYHLEKIFDPYFTTKNRDSTKGSGLGLAIVHSIVNKNRGSIVVKSHKDQGTTFTIYLPAV